MELLKTARNLQKDKEWRVDHARLVTLFGLQRKLKKSEEKEAKDLLELSFPIDADETSDAASVSSFDSQLTSDTSDDGMHLDQGPFAKLRREEGRRDKRERKVQAAAIKACLLYTSPSPRD